MPEVPKPSEAELVFFEESVQKSMLARRPIKTKGPSYPFEMLRGKDRRSYTAPSQVLVYRLNTKGKETERVETEKNHSIVRWTDHEEEVIMQYLKENPDMPVSQAAEELAMIIDRTPKSITLRINKLHHEKGLELPKSEKKRARGAINPAHKTWKPPEKEILIRYYKENQDKPDTENARALAELIGRSEQSVKMQLYRLQQKFGSHEDMLKSLDDKPIVSVYDVLKKGTYGGDFESSYVEPSNPQKTMAKKSELTIDENSPKTEDKEPELKQDGKKGDRTVTTVITEDMANNIMGQNPAIKLSEKTEKQGFLQSFANYFKGNKGTVKPLPEPTVSNITILEADANVQLATRAKILLKSIHNVEEAFAVAMREINGQMEEIQREIEVLENWAADTLRVKDKLKKYAVDNQGVVNNVK